MCGCNRAQPLVSVGATTTTDTLRSLQQLRHRTNSQVAITSVTATATPTLGLALAGALNAVGLLLSAAGWFGPYRRHR